jgi:hypothetical protein
MSETSPFLLRASQAHQWVRCNAYNRMIRDMPDIGDPTVREEGLAFHWAALMVWLGHAMPVGTLAPNKVAIDDDMLDSIDAYIDRIKTWGGAPRLEFTVGAPRIHRQCGGQTDVFTFNMRDMHLHVGDAKYGYRFVSPYENWQLLVYVCGLLDYLQIVDDREVKVSMHIFQPRAYRNGGPWHTWTVNASHLRAYFNTLRNAADSALGDRATCQTGPHCTNCNARLNCDAFDAAVENALEVCGEPINNDITPGRIDGELLRVERALDILEARQAALTARAEMFMRQGKQLQHYELQGGAGRLAWKPDVLPALQSLAEAKKITLFTQKPITPTQAKKLLDPALVDALSDRPNGKLKVQRAMQDRAARVFGETNEV